MADIKAQTAAPFRSIEKEMKKSLAEGPAKAAQAGAAQAGIAQAGDKKPAALDTDGLSPEMAEAIREAEAVSGLGPSDGDDDGDGDLVKATSASEPGQNDPDPDSAKPGRDGE